MQYIIKSKIFHKTMLFTTIATVLLYYIFFIYFAIPKIEHSINRLEGKNAKEILAKIVILSRHVYSDLEYYKKIVFKYKENTLKSVTQLAYSILEYHNKQAIDGVITQSRAKELAYTQIGELRYADDEYFFIVDSNYTIISHPDKKLINKNLFNLKDRNGKFFISEMVNKCLKGTESFTQYVWQDRDNKNFDKLSFTRNFKPWDICIGTGVSIEDIKYETNKRESELFEQLKSIVSSTKIGNLGYIYIFNKDGIMLVHPNDNLLGLDISHLKNPSSGNMLYDDLIKASKSTGELKYRWDKPSDKGNYIYEKISWIEYIPELEWYIASSAYIDELDSSSYELMYRMYLFGIILLMLFLVVSFLFFRRLFRPISDLTNMTSKVTKGDYSVRSKYIYNNEIGVLCQNFNTMVERIDENIQTLDRKVAEKTKKLYQQKNLLYHQAHHDILTGLPNRMFFNNKLEEEFLYAKENNKILAIFFMDLDKFKEINDTLGHKVGDEVLRVVSKRFIQNISPTDTLARLGGDEFTIIIRDLKNTDQASIIADKIISSIKEPVSIDGIVFKISVSIGISLYPTNTKSMIKLLKYADMAMYKAKKDGRSRFRVCLEST
jgi:diguanylate cyclase (GGDEF)-like protein